MPIVLLLALAASLGVHGLVLFGSGLDPVTEPEPLPLVAEIRPMPKPAPPPLVQKPLPQKKRPLKPKADPLAVPVVAHKPADLPLKTDAPQFYGEDHVSSGAVSANALSDAEQAVGEPRLPGRGQIDYRVDRGDSGFAIGVARHEWEIREEIYTLTSVLETTGLVGLFKSVRIQMESHGRMTSQGLRPDYFSIRRNDLGAKEDAAFDWGRMEIRVAGRGAQPLAEGAQDLLSFNYQLGFLPDLGTGSALPIATGKKYGVYRLEVLGDEEIELPAGVLRTLHLRAPGVNTTELWLAYDYLLLPVKIRHVDSKGDSLVQVATHIRLSPE